MEGYQIQTERILLELTESYNNLEFVPILSEMFAKTLVLAAENNFETVVPKEKKNMRMLPYFSKEYKDAHRNHKNICSEWRKSGRPSNSSHPAKAAVLQSRRKVQQIGRFEEASNSIRNHEDLMNTYDKDINQVYAKLKKIRGENVRKTEIPFIETLSGKYAGDNVLEGFCANTEILCNEDEERNESYDNDFYKMAISDEMIIFDITANEDIQVPHLTLIKLKDILFKKLKLKKACDVFKLTVEHLRNAGDNSLLLIMKLLNCIIDNVNFLSSPQLNTSVASVVYKGKGKPLFNHKSHRLVRVTPLFGRIIDEHMRPALVDIVRPMQNINQYGFTETVSYLMGALQRHEVEKYCVDMKKTFFGCSLDGDSAFEVVNRTIQTRELYCAGETGQYWQASHFSYEDSLTRIKMNGKLSRSIEENLGVKQGRNKSSDHYKIYIAPLLDTLDTSSLGVWIGHINVGVSGVADDVYLMSDKQTKLQAQIDIASHYGKMYRISYGASKTKVTVVGSDVDMEYFQSVMPWTMDSKTVQVVDNNEHLGQIVSGKNQEDKNIDLKLDKGRKSLYSLLGSAFSFKCLLSPVVKLHIYRTYTCPRTRSGLSSFSLRSSQLEPLSIFQRKTLKSILKLSITAPTPSIHFLTGELPIEGKIHRDVFSLFYGVWANPDTKISQIVKYLLENTCENSRTWTAHFRHLCRMYELEDPLSCLRKDPPEKSHYKETVLTKITAYHENKLRISAADNSLMTYLNVSTIGLRGRHHPALSNMATTNEVRISRPHLKFLAGNYLTYKIKAEQSGGSPRCRICTTGEEESVSHVISACQQGENIQ